MWEAYEALGAAAGKSSPLDGRTRRLIKLALSSGADSEGAVHSHTRQAMEECLAPGELRQVAVLAITTLGFPTAMSTMSWINDIVKN